MVKFNLIKNKAYLNEDVDDILIKSYDNSNNVLSQNKYIIMNCHNCEKFLDIALKSVLSQSYKNWEIIFWDNNSTDNSAVIAKKIKNNLFTKSKKLLKLGNARRKAVNKSTGDLLAFLDCDDVWLKDKLKLQVSELKNDKTLSLIYSKAEIINENGTKIGLMPSKIDAKSGCVFKDLAKKNFIPFVSVLMKKAYYEAGGFQKIILIQQIIIFF